MPIELKEKKEGKVLEVTISGKLTHEDYQHFVPAVERLFAAHGKISILVEMKDFHGWQASALWDDLKFDVKHFSDIERLAMIGDSKWEKGMSVFCRPCTTARIRYFDQSQAGEARSWVEGDGLTGGPPLP